jgi:hypothetical protein
MSLRALLGLAFLLLCLVGLYFGSHWLERQHDLGRLEDMRMTAFDPAEVQAIAVQQAGGPEVKAVREEGRWKAVAPFESLVPDQERWNRMAAALSILINRRTLEGSPERLKEYGLQDPALRISVEAGEGEALTFTFGKQDPIQMNHYARAEDGTVFLAPTEIFTELNRSVQELRYPYAFTVGPAGITRISFARIWSGKEPSGDEPAPAAGEESVQVVMARDDAESPWRMVAPVEAPASQEPINILAQELQYLRATGHIDTPESLSDYGLEPPNARVTLQAGADPEQTLFIGGLDMSGEPEGKLFAKLADQPGVFLIDGHLISLLPSRPDSFRDRRVLTGTIGDVQRIDFAWEEEQYSIERGTDDGWHITLPEPRDTDQETVSALLAYLKGLEGAAFDEGSAEEQGLAPPQAEITLHRAAGQDPSIIRIGGVAPSNMRYVTQDLGGVLLVPQHQAEALFVPEEHFASKALLRFMTQDVKRLDLRFEGTGYAFDQAGGQWRILEPADAVLQNQSDVEAILKAISGAEAERVEPSEATGLDAPIVELEITWKAGETVEVTRVLRIGAPTSADAQRRYVEIDNRERVYTLSQDVVRVIRESLSGIQLAAKVVN